jgi:hypothetical protein
LPKHEEEVYGGKLLLTVLKALLGVSPLSGAFYARLFHVENFVCMCRESPQKERREINFL